jgi:hypothetical protein
MAVYSIKQIEEFAIARVKDTLLPIDCIDIEIASNDKTPSWDGHIYLYQGKSRSKDALDKRMPVQIKGTSVSDLSKGSRKHAVAVSDIKNYKNDYGCMYLIVEIDKNDQSNRKIFYNVIDPYKASKILKDVKPTNKTKRLKFLELPSGQERIVDILQAALRFRDDRFYIDKTPPRFATNKFVHVIADQAPDDGSILSLDYETATSRVYRLDVNGNEAPVDFSELFAQQFIVGEERIIHEQVSIGERVYFNEYGVTVLPSGYNEIKIRYRFGSLFSVVLSSWESDSIVALNWTYKIDAPNTLSDAVDLEFIEAFRQSHSIESASKTWSFSSLPNDFPDNSRVVRALKKIIEILDCLGIDYSTARISDFDGTDASDINTLHLALVQEKPYTPVEEPQRDQEFGVSKFGPYQIALFWRIGNDGKVTMLDFFAPGKMASFLRDRTTQEITAVPIFKGVRAEDFARIANLHLKTILDEFDNLPPKLLLLGTAASVINELTKAGDIDAGRRMEFFTAASSLLKWLVEKEFFEKPEAQIIELLIAKRTRDLTKQEIKVLQTLSSSIKPQNDSTTVALNLLEISLLLDDFDDAKTRYSALTQHQKKQFRDGIAYCFWKTNVRGRVGSILEVANANGGYVTTREVDDFGFSRMTLSKLVDSKSLVRVDEGIFVLSDVIADDPFFVLQTRFSKGIFSLGSALYLLDLSDRAPLEFDMAFPYGYNSKALAENAVRATHEIEKFYGEGAVQIETPYGNRVVVYCAERTLCDVVRKKNHMDASVVAAAYREYLSRGDTDIEKLTHYAKLLKVTGLIKPYLEVLR